MEFSKQIKKIRTDNQFTQEQLAQQLNVSRQTISSWENDRNLPDLEMVVSIAKLFHISLDQLILGDDQMTNKLVKDSSEVRKAKLRIISGILFVLGVLSFLIKSLIGVKVTQDGVLHEPFFLLPVGYLLLVGALVFLTIALVNKRKKE
ncbi:DUF3955 domain-containing protein [uncultured Vagococcus sp.]|uniref:DUF3955 domain-containing protein n=1 Tax=uncultured Vagococcus sp. TaxID=189676 RepID=UPI0028D755A0|nr:DUF3955 domain-containing protein [uncultured Vagococcus sp.]